MASAVARINCSSTLQANLFQLFQPIGGVSASCSNFWAETLAQAANERTRNVSDFMASRMIPFRRQGNSSSVTKTRDTGVRPKSYRHGTPSLERFEAHP